MESSNNFFILFLGDKSENHIKAINVVITNNTTIMGYKFIKFQNNDNFYEEVETELDNLKKSNIKPILMKGFNIHTEDYIRTIIKYYKKYSKEKFLLTHCAVFDEFILSDAALLTKYTKENIYQLIINGLNLAKKLKYKINNKNLRNVALLNAGGETNFNTASEEWQNIYKVLKTCSRFNAKDSKNTFNIEMEQFDACVDVNVKNAKHNTTDSKLPILIVPSNINEGNSIWKALTICAKKNLAGIVVGIPMSIGLTSRTDNYVSIAKTIQYLINLANYKD